MTKILLSQDITSDHIASKKIVHDKIVNRYRLYVVNQQGKARGCWREQGKLYKDKIQFKYYDTYLIAHKEAKKILHDTKEICVSIEDITRHRLSIIYRDKIEFYKVKFIFKTLSIKRTIERINHYIASNGGCTYYKDKKYYVIYSYKA